MWNAPPHGSAWICIVINTVLLKISISLLTVSLSLSLSLSPSLSLSLSLSLLFSSFSPLPSPAIYLLLQDIGVAYKFQTFSNDTSIFSKAVINGTFIDANIKSRMGGDVERGQEAFTPALETVCLSLENIVLQIIITGICLLSLSDLCMNGSSRKPIGMQVNW